MNIVVRKMDESITWDELADLLHDSFKERLAQGLRFTCSFLSAEEIKQKCKDGVVLVALNIDSGSQLVGTVAFKKLSKSKAEHFNLAIKPSFKHRGVATQLLNALLDLTIQNGCDHIVSDTADCASSSVLWHKKNGFYPVYLRSFSSTNYYSIVFRKQLHYHWFYSNAACCALCFALSSNAYKLFRNINGSLTGFGRIVNFFRKE